MVCHKYNLPRRVSVLALGLALVPVLAGCQEKEPQGRVTTQDGVTGGYEQPSQAPIDYNHAKPMPMPSIDGPPVKPPASDAEIKYPGASGAEKGAEGENR